MITTIDNALLDDVCREAAASPRRRKNRNFHARDDQPGHRLLNAMQPDSYIPPHRHLDPDKGETMVVLRGAVAVFEFDDAGTAVAVTKVGAGGTAAGIRDASLRADAGRAAMQGGPSFIHSALAVGVDVPSGTWHTVVALAPDTVFLEAKAGPYLPLTAEERAPWAPGEGDPATVAYLANLVMRIEGEHS